MLGGRDGREHGRKRVLAILKRLDQIAGDARPLRDRIANPHQMISRRSIRGDPQRDPRIAQIAAQLPGTGAHAVDAEQSVKNRAAQGEQPAQDDPAEGTARVRLGQQCMDGGKYRAAHGEHQDEPGVQGVVRGMEGENHRAGRV